MLFQSGLFGTMWYCARTADETIPAMVASDPQNTNDNKAQHKSEKTHFGFQDVPWEEKAQKVRGVFDSVSSKYDIMNDAMSLGIHRLWKRFTIGQSGVKTGDVVLDVAAGTADLSKAFANLVGSTGHVYTTDINASMLAHGRAKLENHGLIHNISYAQANAECLPFADNSVNCITIAFGLRNVTDKDAALRSMYRVLKSGGRLLVLEFSKPTSSTLNKIYDAYSFKLLPKMGKYIANDEASYQYLAESIRKHPDQETLKQMMLDAGFKTVTYHNLTGGIVALHVGEKA